MVPEEQSRSAIYRNGVDARASVAVNCVEMSEKRRPEFRFRAECNGKIVRIELYPIALFPRKVRMAAAPGMGGARLYRVRVNGKWYRAGDRRWTFVTLSRFFDVFRRSMVKMRAASGSKQRVEKAAANAVAGGGGCDADGSDLHDGQQSVGIAGGE